MKYIAYYRVSTKEQGISGLGLESQRDAVRQFVSSTPGGDLVAEYTDVESGTKRERAGLKEAIQHAFNVKAILVVKRLDRLSRGGYKLMFELEELGIKFIESDSPNDNDLVREIKLSLARDEARKVSERTSAALSVIKKRISNGEEYISKSGKPVTQLGNPGNLNDKALANSIASRQRKAFDNEDNRRAGAFIVGMYNAGLSFYAITKKLNEGGFKTSTGGTFSQGQTKRLYERFSKSF